MEGRLHRLGRRVHETSLHFRRLDRIWSIIALFSGVALLRKFVEMGAEMQRLQFQIAALTQDFEGVPAVMDRLVATTSKVPFTLNTMAQAFVRLKASGIDPITDDQGNGPLRAMADALAAFGGGDELFKRMTIAIQQMAGKGVISMEELRQQLGEAVPTAMRVMAEQMRISVAQLILDVSRGRVEFEEGFDALIKGFDEKFHGLGEVMKNTFTGQLQQTVTEFQVLSEALFVKSGAFDQVAAGLGIMNAEIRKFSKFLQSDAGQEAINKFWDGIRKIAVFAAQASTPLIDLIGIIKDLVGAISAATSSLPAEVVGGGLIGFILFGGRKGAAAGALFGAFSDEIRGVIQIITGLVQTLFGFLSALGLEDVAAGGLIGFFIFGRKGGLITAAILYADEVFTSINKIVTIVIAIFLGLWASIKAQANEFWSDPTSLFDEERLLKVGREAGWKTVKAYIEGAKAAGDYDTGILGEIFDVEGGSEFGNEAAKATDDFFKSMAELAKKVAAARAEILAAQQPLEDIGGPSPTDLAQIQKLGTYLERLEKQAAGAGTQIGNLRAEIAQKLGGVDKIIGNLNKQIDKLPEGDSKIAGLKASIDTLTATKGQIAALGETIIANISAEQFEKTEQQVARLSETFDEFLVGTTEGFTAQELAIQKVEARFAGYQLRIQQLTKAVMDNIDADHGQAAALALLTDLQNKMNAARENAIKLTREQAEATRMKTEADIAERIVATDLVVTGYELSNSFDEVALAGLRAREQLNNTFKNIADQIQRIQEQQQAGIISEVYAQASIERLQELQTRLGELADKFVEVAEFNASAWGKLMNNIYQSMEDFLANSIHALVTGTKTFKEVLLDFYDEITRAVIRYLAHQALVGVFGGQGGFGLGSFLLPFGGSGLLGGLLGFAHGGSFMVGGKGGVDNNVLSLNGSPVAKVSQGETVSVTPQGDPSFGDLFNITIQAIDALSVRDLFMKEGSSLVEAILRMRRLNRA